MISAVPDKDSSSIFSSKKERGLELWRERSISVESGSSCQTRALVPRCFLGLRTPETMIYILMWVSRMPLETHIIRMKVLRYNQHVTLIHRFVDPFLKRHPWLLQFYPRRVTVC